MKTSEFMLLSLSLVAVVLIMRTLARPAPKVTSAAAPPPEKVDQILSAPAYWSAAA